MKGCCATCAYWQRPHDEERGECEATSVDHTGRPIHPDSKAHAEPGSTSTWAVVLTAPDFGCVQYVKEA